MKTTFILLSFAGMLSHSVFGQNESYALESTSQVQKNNKNGVWIPSDFSEGILADLSNLKSLNGHRIQHIDLVYTKFKLNPNFDQVALNKNRIKALKKAYPKVSSDHPSWSWVEQTGATSPETAESYFHGFIIYYADELDYATLNNFFNDSSNDFTHYTINNSVGGDLTFSSGSVVHVPANCVVDSNGKPITGNYELNYREFRDPAQIALSGIPMDFQEKGQEFLFNSAGMYELRANQNGNDLKLSKPITVDFNCTQQIKDVAFYQLNDKTGVWTKEQAIDFRENTQSMGSDFKIAATEQGAEIAVNPMLKLKKAAPAQENANPSKVKSIETNHGQKESISTLSDLCWESYLDIKKSSPRLVQLYVVKENPDKKELTILREGVEELTNTILFNPNFQPKLISNVDAGSTLLAAGSKDPGHTYPNLVAGLNSPTFGVYNCDQQFRMGEVLVLKGEMKDKATGKNISNAHVACLIDKGINGSFSYDPRFISMNPNSENIILVFTKDKKVYALKSEEIAALNIKANPSTTLAMTDVTDQVKSSTELKKFLGI